MADFNGGGMAALGSDQDLQEGEVWAVMKASEGHACSNSKSKSNSKTRKLSGSGTIPRSAAQLEGPSRRQSSASVRIPDWSKILHKQRQQSNKNPWSDADDGMNNASHENCDGVDDGGMVPPHEYLARKLASTQIASFSMCEGVGRTLKGRDLSNLRNAILTKTGFLE